MDLTSALKRKYPVRVKMFNIEKPPDYAVYSRLEAIHSRDKFSVPLIMIGDDILIGEKQIASELEEKIRRLNAAGGSGLPYLGKALSGKSGMKSSCPGCDSQGQAKPSSLGEDSGKIRIIEDEPY